MSAIINECHDPFVFRKAGPSVHEYSHEHPHERTDPYRKTNGE
jgi:hypothetical protein